MRVCVYLKKKKSAHYLFFYCFVSLFSLITRCFLRTDAVAGGLILDSLPIRLTENINMSIRTTTSWYFCRTAGNVSFITMKKLKDWRYSEINSLSTKDKNR